MAGSKSDYLENALQKHMAKVAAYTAPATWYFALFTAAPTDAGGGTECTGGGYVRKSVSVDGVNFTVSVSTLANAIDILFAALSGSIGTTVAWGIYDAASAGNLLYWGDLAVGDQKAYVANDQPLIPAGSLTITED